MVATTQTVQGSNKTVWAGYVVSALPVLFLVFDAVIKLMQIAPVVESFALLGYPIAVAFGIGVLELLCIALYVFPRTSVLGAVVLTGYLGGAIASHVRIGSDLFSLVFPVIIGGMVWAGLFLRDTRLRALVPFLK